MIHSFRLFFVIFSLFSTIFADTSSQRVSVQKQAAEIYVNANTNEIRQDGQNTENLSWLEKKNPLLQTKQNVLSDRDVCLTAFDIVDAQFNQDDFVQPVPITGTEIQKMELFAGGQNKKQHVLSALFPHITSKLGIAYATYQLCSPTTNQEVITQHQETIRLLAEDENLLFTVQGLIKSLSQYEQSLFSYWSEKSVFNEEYMQQCLYFNVSGLKKLNQNTVSLELANDGMDLFWALYSQIIPLSTIFSTMNAVKKRYSCGWYDAIKITKDKIFPEVIDSLKAMTNTPEERKKLFLYGGLGAIYFVGTSVFTTYISVSQMKAKHRATHHLQKILIDISSYLETAKKISIVLKEHPDLIKVMPTLTPIIDLFDSKKNSAKLNKLVALLDTNTFKGSPSFFSLLGRVLAAHKIMEEIKSEFEPALYALAQLDAHAALASLYNQHHETETPYCFVTLNSDGPSLYAQQSWNPILSLSEHKAITNDVLLGGTKAKNNIILSGPNMGGKSTVLKSLWINVLLAQTFGIAAAQEFSFSPFSHINCYLNITDDIAAGVSLFKAEVLRAKELLEGIQSLQPDEYAFTIMDEIFSGTSPQEGETAAYHYAKQLENYPGSINVIATHYGKLLDLESNTDAYQNHHVEVLKSDDGKLTFTYKLRPGPSRMNIALDILRQEGILIED